MKNKILLTLSICIIFQTYCLSGEVRDSLFGATGKQRLDLLNILASQNSLDSPREAMNYTNEAIKLATELKDTAALAKAYFNLGNSYYFAGYYPESKNSFIQSKDFFQIVNYKTDYAVASVEVAKKAIILKQFDEAQQYFEEAIKVLKEEKEIVLSVNTLIEYSKGLRASKNAKALEVLDEALKISDERMRDRQVKPLILFEKGNYFFAIGEFDKAIQFYTEAKGIYDKIKDKQNSAECLMNIGYAQKELGNNVEAQQKFITALPIYEQMRDREGLRIVYDNLYRIEYEKQNYKEALVYLEKYTEILKEYYSMNVFRAESQKRLERESNNREKYEMQSRQQELEKQRVMLEKKAKEMQLATERSKLISMVVLLSLLIIVAFFLYKQNKSKKKINIILEDKNVVLTEKNIEIESQKKAIQEKNDEILAGIRYARQIQYAILPTEEEAIQIFKDYFIFFKPKDIVSGDFYWFYQNETYIYITVADCTGHGVAGAFMSLIGTVFQNEIIIEKKVSNPSKILKLLNAAVKDALKQEDFEANQDGMDIAIVRISKKDKVLTFSGAKRPLYYFDNDKLIEIKGDRFSIGGMHLSDVEFTEIDVNIKNNMKFYLATDGFADQNNADNKKYNSKQLKLLLEKIHNEDMTTQLALMENEFNSFKGDEPQRDDITILGFKF